MTATVNAGSVYCERSDLPVSMCGHCRVPEAWQESFTAERRQRERERKPSLLGKPFLASYPGECSRCEKPFEAGDKIRTDFPGPGYVSMVCCPNARAKRGEING